MEKSVSFWATPAAGATIALLGVLLTAIVTTLITQRSRKWQLADDRQKLTLEKGEELYSLVRRWWLSQMSWFGQSKLAMTGAIDYDKFLDMYIKSNEGVDLKVERICLLFAAYFPEHDAKWEECVRLIRFAAHVEADFKDDYKAGIFSGPAKLPELENAMLVASKQIEQTLISLSQRIRQVANNS